MNHNMNDRSVERMFRQVEERFQPNRLRATETIRMDENYAPVEQLCLISLRTIVTLINVSLKHVPVYDVVVGNVNERRSRQRHELGVDRWLLVPVKVL